MLKPPIKEDLEIKIGIMRNNGGFPDPVRILSKVLQLAQWLPNKELAEYAHVSQNNVSQIRRNIQGDVKVSILAKILASLPPNLRAEFFAKWEAELFMMDDIALASPEIREELMGEISTSSPDKAVLQTKLNDLLERTADVKSNEF